MVDYRGSVAAQLGDKHQAGIVFAGYVSIAGTIQGDCGDEVAGARSHESGVAQDRIDDQRLAPVVSGDFKVNAVVGGNKVAAVQQFWISVFRFLIEAVRGPSSIVRGASQLTTDN